MRRPATKKRIVRKKSARRRAGVKRADSATTLAASIVTAPYLVEAKAAQARMAGWLAGLPAKVGKLLKTLLAAHPIVEALLQSLAESSPYLWDLASSDPVRLLRLLMCDPDAHLAALLSDNGEAAAATDD